MIRPTIRLRAVVRLLAALFCVAATPAWAQSDACEQLRQAIAAASQANPQRTAQFVRAAQRQRTEIARSQAYADQIGCSHGFSIFGSDSPPQCDAIDAQIERMNGNLNALEQQISQDQDGDSGRQAALEDQYRATCGPDAASANADGTIDDGMRPGFDTPSDDQQPDGGPRRYAKAICVRTCDGGFFPLSFSPAEHDATGLQNLCTALCPNTEAKLYTTPDLDNIAAAVSIDGASYTDLPAAFRYQKAFDSTCTCKPPNKSWVEALADAEKLLQNSEKDVTVTAKMSDEMARPVASTPAPAKKKSFSKAEIKALLDAQAAAEGALGAVGAQAPTAGTESAGIAANAGSLTDHVVRTGEGAVRSLPGPDGAKRRVRIIGPTL